MPDIKSSGGTAPLTAAAKQTEANTHNLADVLELLRNELRRLRLGDTSPGDEAAL